MRSSCSIASEELPLAAPPNPLPPNPPFPIPPLDGGAGPVRWAVLYRGNSAYLFAGASRASRNGVPEADGLFQSVAQTLRGLKPSEAPLAEPFRLRIKTAQPGTRLADSAGSMPEEKYAKEQLQLINGLYPNGEPRPGALYKVVE